MQPEIKDDAQEISDSPEKGSQSPDYIERRNKDTKKVEVDISMSKSIDLDLISPMIDEDNSNRELELSQENHLSNNNKAGVMSRLLGIGQGDCFLDLQKKLGKEKKDLLNMNIPLP